ncbi:phospholipase D-like domain-containing protein [Rhizobium ruizarguesonis]
MLEALGAGLQRLPNVVIAVGNQIPFTGFDQRFGELERIVKSVNIHWIHTKFMPADPLPDDPIVVTGSANFRDPSTDTNDENMLIIRGNTRVADIYFGEFAASLLLCLAVSIFLANNPGKTPDDYSVRFLVEDRDWTEDYFTSNDANGRYCRRRYFAGSCGSELCSSWKELPPATT